MEVGNSKIIKRSSDEKFVTKKWGSSFFIQSLKNGRLYFIDSVKESNRKTISLKLDYHDGYVKVVPIYQNVKPTSSIATQSNNINENKSSVSTKSNNSYINKLKHGNIIIEKSVDDKQKKGNITFSEDRNIENIIVSKTVSSNFDVPIQTPISGSMEIRKDIEVKEGITQGTVLLINPTEEYISGLKIGHVFSEEANGEFIVQSLTKELSGGEMSAPYLSYSVNFIGISKKGI